MQLLTARISTDTKPYLYFEDWGGRHRDTNKWPCTWLILTSSTPLHERMDHIPIGEALYVSASHTWHHLPT